MPNKKTGLVAKYNRNLTPREVKLTFLLFIVIVAVVLYVRAVNDQNYLSSYSSPTYSSATSSALKTPAPSAKPKTTPVYRAK